MLETFDSRKGNLQQSICQARGYIEYVFVVLSNKWGIFHRPFNVLPQFAHDIIKACIILHNYEGSYGRRVLKFDEIKYDDGFFFPHHCVLRYDNRARPLTVVFNDSQKTNLNISLNDLLRKGGTIQEDLFSIMLRARKHCYFFTCDICHMFRQIEINPQQRHFQKIFWKRGPNEPVQIYKLKEITYGRTPAGYLSTRVLKQLAMDENDNFPIAANVVLQDVYLDDILTGYSSLHELELLKTELIVLFKSAGMSFHKWSFSHANSESPDLNFDQLSEELWVFCGIVPQTPYVSNSPPFQRFEKEVSLSLASDLVKSELWWKGPDFSKLVLTEHFQNCTNGIKEELKTSVTKTLLLSAEIDLFHKIDSVTHNFCKLIRILSYTFGFIKNAKSPSDKRIAGPLTQKELTGAAI
ncbi:hypothetical protein HNY73_011845 [Argiope bruennichi]|uniref:Reverse transcriptase domain-containing protein n=1 Tax=Argiope bruennichi TaxID=94029 RepID=A0A8T0EUN8_ARGBR|nr:hypothetical protein HNY73_011845 [Argiope bruennichi]